jgi:hypothetical protein
MYLYCCCQDSRHCHPKTPETLTNKERHDGNEHKLSMLGAEVGNQENLYRNSLSLQLSVFFSSTSHGIVSVYDEMAS